VCGGCNILRLAAVVRQSIRTETPSPWTCAQFFLSEAAASLD
jgi:hypothetical protein